MTRDERIVVAKKAIEDLPYDPHAPNLTVAFEPGYGTLKEFVYGTWISNDADTIFQRAAEAVIDALDKD